MNVEININYGTKKDREELATLIYKALDLLKLEGKFKNKRGINMDYFNSGIEIEFDAELPE